MVDWSDPKTLFVFVIDKHKFVICVCVPFQNSFCEPTQISLATEKELILDT